MAFPDSDGPFGSVGSFFDYDFLGAGGGGGGRRKQRRGGCFQANPPFASDFILKMCKRMEGFLSRTDDDTPPLMFVVFVPAWKDSPGWNALTSCPYLTRHVVLSQKADKHYYAEGTQHRRKGGGGGAGRLGGRHRVASFNTSVFFMQNAAAKRRRRQRGRLPAPRPNAPAEGWASEGRRRSIGGGCGNEEGCRPRSQGGKKVEDQGRRRRRQQRRRL